MILPKVKRIERGWGAHYILGHRCLFRRNTLLDPGSAARRVIVSTVGALVGRLEERLEEKIETIGHERWYETMAWFAKDENGYVEADISRGSLQFKADWSIRAKRRGDLPKNVDAIANDMHERVVDEFILKLDNLESLRADGDDFDGETMADDALG